MFCTVLTLKPKANEYIIIQLLSKKQYLNSLVWGKKREHLRSRDIVNIPEEHTLASHFYWWYSHWEIRCVTACESLLLIMLLTLVKHSCLPWEFHFLPSAQGFSLLSISMFFSALFSVLNFPPVGLLFVLWMYHMHFTLVFAVPLAKFYPQRSISLILFSYPLCSFFPVFETRNTLL